MAAGSPRLWFDTPKIFLSGRLHVHAKENKKQAGSKNNNMKPRNKGNQALPLKSIPSRMTSRNVPMNFTRREAENQATTFKIG